MTPQELKNSILQRAIQGRLVEQRPEEGTGEELYRQIQAEKRRLVKEGKIKKEKSLPELTEDEIPFDIPESWKWVRLGETFIIERGGSPRPIKDYLTDAEDGVNWIKIGDTDIGGKYINSTKEKIIPEGVKKSRFVHKGDFLLSNSMSFGRPYILNIDGCIHDGWLVLRFIGHAFNQDYLYYLLSSSMVFHQFSRRVAGAVVNNLNSEKVAQTLIPLPPLAEQRRIVSKIEELLPHVDRYGTAWSRLETFNKRFPSDMRKSLLQQAIQGRLVEQRPEEGTGEELYRQIQAEKRRLVKEGKIKKEKPLPEITEDEIPFDIPESWKWVRFGQVIDVRDGTHNTPAYVQEGVPLVTSKNLVSGKIDFSTAKQISYADSEEINSRSFVEDGDILFAMIGTIGNPVLVKKEREFCIKNMALFKAVSQRLFNMNYLLLFLQNEQYAMKKNAVGGVQSFVSLRYLRNYIFPLPPLPEQRRIVERLEELLPLCERLQ